MSKKIIAILLSCVLTVGLLGCSQSTPAASQEGSNTPAPSADGKKLSAVFLGFRFGDKGWNDSLKAGVEEAGELYADQIDVRCVDVGNDIKKYQSALVEASEGDDELIIISGFEFQEIVEEVAPQYPDKRYILCDSEVDYQSYDLENVVSTGYMANESGFLAGMVAAYMTTSDNENINPEKIIGFVGGTDNTPSIWDFLVGYTQGAAYVDPEIKVAVSYVGDFSDAPKAKELSLSMINNQKVDIIFSAAGSSGIGTIEACAEKGVYVIGCDLDQSQEFVDRPNVYKAIVTSALKRAGMSLTLMINEFVNDELEFGKHRIFGMNEGCSDLVYNDTFKANVDGAFEEKIKKAFEDVGSGSIEVKSAYAMTKEEINEFVGAYAP